MTTYTPQETLTLEDIQDLWPTLSENERLEAFSLLGREDSQEFFFTLTSKERTTIILNVSTGEQRIWMRLLPADDAAEVIRESPEEMRSSMLGLLDDRTRQEVSAILSYSKDAAGGLMNPRFGRLRPELSADEAIRYVRLQAQDRLEGIYYVFVLDDLQHLLGVVSLHDLFRAAPDKKVIDIMRTEVVSVRDDQDKESVGQLFSQYKFLAIPVVDSDNRIKGIITADDILQTVQEEATEDIQKMGGMEALNEPYLNVGFFHMLKKRAGWLAALFLGEMLTASAMSYFEQEIAKAVVLALFVPLIISSGGNSGSQAATLVIRAMALGEVRLKDWWKVVHREVGMGLGLGIILAAIGFLRIILWHALFHSYGEHYLLIATSVSISLVGIVLWGTTAGSVLPLLLRKAGFDPASASAPFVATLVDVSGILIYFSVSAFLLRGTLL